MHDIVIIGGGGHAKVLISILKKLGSYRLLGYTDIQNKGELLGIKYLGDDTVLERLIKKNRSLAAALGLGTVAVDDKRPRILENLEYLGFALPAVISPQAVINEDVVIGSATVIFDGAIVNSGTKIGKAVILNTKSSVDHDCEIEDFVHIAPGATLSGGVKVGKNSLIGTGANVIQYKRIGENCVVGAGSTIIDDITEPGTYVGNPAKRIT